MKRTGLVVGILTTALLATVAAPLVEAQCPTARIFSGVAGRGLVNSRIDGNTNPIDKDGNEIGRFWDSADWRLSNNFDGSCPSSLWFDYTAAGHGRIDGAFTEGSCAQTGCPGNDLTVLVENYGVGGPGQAFNAYFVIFQVDETPGAFRWYDLGRVNGSVGGLVPWHEFPQPTVVASYRGHDGTVRADLQLIDVDLHTNSAQGPSDMRRPATDMIVSYDVMTALSIDDPGRDRSAWTVVARVPYSGSGAFVTDLPAPCVSVIEDNWFAIGMTFRGGPGQDDEVESALVGRAIQLECQPNLADPDGIKEFQARPRPIEQKDPGQRGKR